MQTFLPYEDFAESARVLDRQRLGKQRVETMQIMKALLTGQGWIHHPATKMWAGYELALLIYQTAICQEWTENRGYKDTCLDKTEALVLDYMGTKHVMKLPEDRPPWLGDEDFHLAHRSMLLQKDPEHYSQFFPADTPTDLDYKWPVS